MSLKKYQVAVLKRVLEKCTDEELADIFGQDLIQQIQDRVDKLLQDRRFRPPAVYDNHSPFGIADEIRK